MGIENLQIVVIDEMKYHWDNPLVRQLYCDLMQIKIDGYGSVYGENVISLDKADFFGTHLMVCEKGEKLTPLFGYKSVTFDRCDEYHHSFPAISLVLKDGHKECLTKLLSIVEEAKLNKESTSFDYSWAQNPQIKSLRTKSTKKLYRDLVMTLVVNHHQDYGIEHMITCGVVKVKTDLFFENMGMNKISDMSLFSQKDLNGEDVHIFHAQKYSKYAYAVALQYYELWNNRLEFKRNASGQIAA